MARHYTHQVFVLDKDRRLIHCGPRNWCRVAGDVIRRHVRKWMWWRLGMARKHPEMRGEDAFRQAFVLVRPYAGGATRCFAADGTELKGGMQ